MENILRQHHLKVTKGRVEVLKLLKEKDRPMTAEEDYSIIPRGVCSSLSTVYRILNQLSEKNILKKTLKQNGISYYSMASEDHRHFIICSQCGDMEEVFNCPISEEAISKETGYTLNNHVLELMGLCPKCKNKQ